MTPGVAADGREEPRAFRTQTDEQLKSSSVMEGGFSLQPIETQNERECSAADGTIIFVRARWCDLLLVRPRHAGHTLLLPSSERPGRGLNQQIEQELVLQIGLIGLEQFQDGGAETEMQLEDRSWKKSGNVFLRRRRTT